VLYLDVSPEDIAALDRFEGDAYRREVIDVLLADGATVPAATYIHVAPGLSAVSWEPDAFQLQRFLQTYCRERLDPD
jgi:hypothetical protein